MHSSASNFFITAEELEKELGSPGLRIVDGSWYLPAMGRDGRAEFEAARIPGAQYFDINAIADTTSDLPHMLPSPEIFAEAVGKMGIGENDRIVVYDGPGLFSSARVWWSFRVMGAENVRILAGGFDQWKSGGHKVETGSPAVPEPATFTANFSADKVRDSQYMRANLKKGATLVLDARPLGRFTGEVPEPREGLRGGHIPGSEPLPAADLVRNGRLLPLEELLAFISSAGVNPNVHVTTTCGSGVTAAILSLALETVGHRNHSLYDGSWADWGRLDNVPVARWE